MEITRFINTYTNPAVLKTWLLGLASGLSLLLSGNTLNFWISEIGVNKVTISLFSLVALPYALKYFLAPIIDRVNLPYLSKQLGRKKSWILVTQIMLIISLYFLGRADPAANLLYTAVLGFLVALLAVLQDIVLDSYRVGLLADKNKGPGSAMYIFGYRMGMLISGAGAIFLSSFLSWEEIYNVMALIIFLSMTLILFTFTGKDEKHDVLEKKNRIRQIFVQPFKHLGSIKQIIIIVSFLLTYRIADHFIMVMINPFLLSLGYSDIEISSAGKLFGFFGVIAGGFLSGYIMQYISIKRSLLIFGGLHSVGHIFYIAQTYAGKHIILLYFLTGIESITGGMTMTAYIAFMTNLCKGKNLATQYAFLSSIMGLSRVLFPTSSGLIVDEIGWVGFFTSCILMSLIGLLIIPYIKTSKPLSQALSQKS